MTVTLKKKQWSMKKEVKRSSKSLLAITAALSLTRRKKKYVTKKTECTGAITNHHLIAMKAATIRS